MLRGYGGEITIDPQLEKVKIVMLTCILSSTKGTGFLKELRQYLSLIEITLTDFSEIKDLFHVRESDCLFE